jgi:hypothetical protein
MKRILYAALITATLTAPALAAKLYLKDGGVIQAKRVWRSDGKVYVLATRDTLTSFEPSEVNLKRTFPKRHKVVHKKRIGAVRPAATAATPAREITTPNAAGKATESPTPPSGNGGTIRQHKKEMEERIGE